MFFSYTNHGYYRITCIFVHIFIHTQDESLLNGAFIIVDPFKEETFRDKYFGADVIAKEHSTKHSSTKRLATNELQSNCESKREAEPS